MTMITHCDTSSEHATYTKCEQKKQKSGLSEKFCHNLKHMTVKSEMNCLELLQVTQVCLGGKRCTLTVIPYRKVAFESTKNAVPFS